MLIYRVDGEQLELLHAEIDARHRRQGFALQLTRAALDDARARHLFVLPYCPYVRDFIARHREKYVDLVADDRRAAFDLG